MGTYDGCVRPGGIIVPSDLLIVEGSMVRAFARMPTSQIRDMGHPILWLDLDVGHPPTQFVGSIYMWATQPGGLTDLSLAIKLIATADITRHTGDEPCLRNRLF